MPKYLFIGSYTADGTRGLLKEGGTGRSGAAYELIGSLGGKVETFYFAFGGDDFYLVAELPSATEAAAVALAVAASGAINYRTVVLLTPEEIDAAARLKPTFRPPYREYRGD
jgi:uncharacterized protein with GYD domain